MGGHFRFGIKLSLQDKSTKLYSAIANGVQLIGTSIMTGFIMSESGVFLMIP